MNQQKNQPEKKLHPFWRSMLPSLLATVGVALVLGWQSEPITDETTRGEILLTWFLNILWGTLAHNLVLLVGLFAHWLPRKKSLGGMAPVMLLGAFATYGGLLAWYYTPAAPWQAWVEALVSVLLISGLIQALIYPTQAYDRLLELGQKRAALRAKSQELVLRIDGQELRLDPGLVSCIWVEDHYLHFIHQEGETWRETVVHGKLKELGQAFGPYLIQVSRSALINPKWSKGWQAGLLLQAGMPDPIKVPQARMDEVVQAVAQRRQAG